MSQVFEEDKLRFEFGSQWKVERYDGKEGAGTGTWDGHPFYRNQVSRLPATKAVDFVGVITVDDTYLIEVKDFRGYRIKNKKRLTSGDLALEVAYKVRDTVAGLVGAVRNEASPTVLSASAKMMLDRTKCVRVVLWLEDDAAVNPKAWAEELNTLTTRIQSYLRWLTARVLVVSQSTHADKPPHLQVSNVPGAAAPTT